MVALAVGAVRFNGGGETLPSSVARRLRVGGIFVYTEESLQVDKWNLRACTLTTTITLLTLRNCSSRQSEDVLCIASLPRDRDQCWPLWVIVLRQTDRHEAERLSHGYSQVDI